MAEATAKSESDTEPDKVENEFSSPWSCSDMVLLVEGRQLHACKVVLGMVSPVLQTMLNQASDKAAQEVALPLKKYAHVVEFLRCVHPHVSKDVTDEWLEVLLSLAEEFQCKTLTQKCRTFLKNQMERYRLQREATQASNNSYYKSSLFTEARRLKENVSGQTVLRWLRLAGQFLPDEGLLQGLARELQPRMGVDQLTAAEDFEKLDHSVIRRLFRIYAK